MECACSHDSNNINPMGLVLTLLQSHQMCSWVHYNNLPEIITEAEVKFFFLLSLRKPHNYYLSENILTSLIIIGLDDQMTIFHERELVSIAKDI